ncbi:MAG: type II secretion system GspH family protein [Myxococcales bacterium]|nr:type II secretion system GspH family protein [Myxococcales bacterium]
MILDARREAGAKEGSRETRARSGFTLLEVMVSIAILALSFTAIFASEGGAIMTAHRARKMAAAASLARCKMGEIEEQVAAEGLPAVDDHDRDECCEGAELEGYRCEWRLERVVLPDEMGGGEEGGDDPLSSLADQASATESLDTMLAGGVGDPGGMASMAFAIAFPILKPAIEEQVRRATVTVFWEEGSNERSFDVVQFLVAEQPTNQEEE